MELISNVWNKFLFFGKRNESENDDIEESAVDIARLAKRRSSCNGRISGASRLSQCRHTLYDSCETNGPDIADDLKEFIRDKINTFRGRSSSDPKMSRLTKQRRKQSLYDYYSTKTARVVEETAETKDNYGRRSVSDSGDTSALGLERKRFLCKLSVGNLKTKDTTESGETNERGARSGRRRSLSGNDVIMSREQTRKQHFAGADQVRRPENHRLQFRNRRHSFVGLDSLVESKDVNGTEDESILDIVKEKIFRPERRRSELISESVARKLAERKKELKTLTRQQTITYMKIKYDL